MTSKEIAARLVRLTGNNFFEIKEPETGWTKLHKYPVMGFGGGGSTIGKFFITAENGNINYDLQGFQILNLQHYHPSLMDLGLSQLEEKCAERFSSISRSRKFPYLDQLLMKYYGLH